MEQQNKHPRYVFGSLTRISDLERRPFSVQSFDRDLWETGDYIVGVFSGTPPSDTIELCSGRFCHIMKGDHLVGALGARRSTKEAVGDWRQIGTNGVMEDLTGAGLFGREISHAPTIPPSPHFIYVGHVVRGGSKVCMKHFVTKPSLCNEDDGRRPRPSRSLPFPVILLVGTSMSSGKTSAARIVIHLLKEMGVRKVVGVKFAGAGCQKDIWSMRDAGADAVFDFVDAGLPSSIAPPTEYNECFDVLLEKVVAEKPDVLVAETGASPCEPYNGSIAVEGLRNALKLFVVLCASDPYSVVGFLETFVGIKPDIVTGIIANNSAGRSLVEEMADVPAMDLNRDEVQAELERRFASMLGPKTCGEGHLPCLIDE